jgi:hypothetical protein
VACKHSCKKFIYSITGLRAGMQDPSRPNHPKE